MDSVNTPAKFEVRSFTRSWDNRGYLKNLGSPWIGNRSLFSQIFKHFIIIYCNYAYRPTAKFLKNLRMDSLSWLYRAIDGGLLQLRFEIIVNAKRFRVRRPTSEPRLLSGARYPAANNSLPVTAAQTASILSRLHGHAVCLSFHSIAAC